MGVSYSTAWGGGGATDRLQWYISVVLNLWYLRQMFSEVVVGVKRLRTTGLYGCREVAVAQKVEQVG